jgi:hypothetical protein
MARSSAARTPTPGQLTIEDWAEVLKANPPAPEPPPADTMSVDARAAVDAAQNGHQNGSNCRGAATVVAARHHPVATDLLDTPGALLTRTHLRELGLERRAVDAVFRKLPVVTLPGYSRPMIHVEQYLELIDEHTYRDDRVQPRHA